jgi:hypothetical protein
LQENEVLGGLLYRYRRYTLLESFSCALMFNHDCLWLNIHVLYFVGLLFWVENAVCLELFRACSWSALKATEDIYPGSDGALQLVAASASAADRDR